MEIFVLWQSEWPEDGIIGLYSSEANARAAWQRRRDKRLFPNSEPDICAFDLDVDWDAQAGSAGQCLCIVGCSVNGECPIHGDRAMPIKGGPQK